MTTSAKRYRRRRGKPWLRVLLVIATLSAAGAWVWLRADTEPDEAPAETVQVRRETLERTIAATGVIRPTVGAEIDVGSRVSGIVRRIPVRVGDRVDPHHQRRKELRKEYAGIDFDPEDPVVVESTNRIFNREALRAILRWKFRPRIVDGRPTRREATTDIEFNFDDPEGG